MTKQDADELVMAFNAAIDSKDEEAALKVAIQFAGALLKALIRIAEAAENA